MTSPHHQDPQVGCGPEASVPVHTAHPWWLKGAMPWLLYGALIFCIVGVLAVAVQVLQPEQFLKLESLLRCIGRAGALAQVAGVAWIVWRWRRIVAWGRMRGFVHKREHRAVLALRRSAAGWLTLYLVLIPVGPRRLLAAAQAWLN